MQLNLSQLKTYSLCPRYYFFQLEKKQENKITRVSIIKKVIQKAYLRQAQNKYVIPWRVILEWTNKEIFRLVNIKIPNSYEKIKTLTESIILPLNSWYFEIFKKEKTYGYINVPISQTLEGVLITDTAPVIKLTKPITVVSISDLIYDDIKIYNDIYDRGLLYLVSKNLREDKIRLEHYSIGPEARFYRSVIKNSKELNLKTERTLSSIAKAIFNNINYPSFTEMCNTCQYRKDCVI